MPSTQLQLDQVFNLVTATYGTFTITNNSLGSDINALAEGMIGYAVGPLGSPSSARFMIVDVESPGVIDVKLEIFEGTSTTGVEHDFHLYAGGLVYFEKQLASS